MNHGVGAAWGAWKLATHIILRPKTYLFIFLLLKLVIIIIINYLLLPLQDLQGALNNPLGTARGAWKLAPM